MLGRVDQIIPALEVGGGGVQAQLVADQAVQALLVQHARHFVDDVHVPHADHAPFGHVGEQRDLGALFAGMRRSARHSRASAWMPISRSFCTVCCVGLVLSSPAVAIQGREVRCTKVLLFAPMRRLIWGTASRNGSDSMSPTVPPISTIATSTATGVPMPAPRCMNSWISLVTWGMTCTVLPR